MGRLLRFAMDAGPYPGGVVLTRPTPVALRRAPLPGGDGEAHCSKVRSDEVQDGPSCGAKPATGPCGFTSLEQERPSVFVLPFWCARSASKGDQQPYASPL